MSKPNSDIPRPLAPLPADVPASENMPAAPRGVEPRGDASYGAEPHGDASYGAESRGAESRGGEPRGGEPLLQVRGLNAWYGAAHILFDVSLHVGRGEVVALMGRNGAGKSTTLKALMGMLDRRRGEVRFMGHDISRKQPFQIARAGLGFVPEDRRVFTDLSVADNLEVGRQPPRRWPDGSAAPHWTAAQMYTLFPNLGAMINRPAGRMSGGEQQMLTVARTLMGNPYLVLLDEPSEGVAPLIVEQMAATILALKAQGASILLSEQNVHFAQWVSDRAYVLEKGQVRYSGTMRELAADEDVRRAYLAV
jgi:branched-chain amino acid transport system ATP-binding protein